MNFRHTSCQICDANEESGDLICQLCNDLCSSCCMYGAEHPPRKCPDVPRCNKCAPGCEWCVYQNHTVLKEPGKTYNGELPDKCDHIGKTRLMQDQDKLKALQKRIRDSQERMEQLEQEKIKLQSSITLQEETDMQKKKTSRKQVSCRTCGKVGHNSRTCSKRAKTSTSDD